MDAIVLAAGQGSRLGGPKALLGFGKPPLPLALAHVNALAGRCHRIAVVTRADVARILSAHVPRDAPVALVTSTAAEAEGPAGSIAAAIAELRDDALSGAEGDEPVLITPVDCLPVSATTFDTLLEALSVGLEIRAVRPRHAGRGGHPVLIRRSELARYRRPAPPPLRDVLAALGSRCLDVVVDDDRVVADLDTGVDVERWTGAPPSFIDWQV